MVLVWLSAVSACSIHCLEDNCHCDSIKMGPMSASSGQSHAPDNDDHSFCLSLHHLTPAPSVGFWITPDFKLALRLNFHSTALALSFESLKNPILRQPPDREFVFTPEVSLGAALRSHAPPAFA